MELYEEKVWMSWWVFYLFIMAVLFLSSILIGYGVFSTRTTPFKPPALLYRISLIVDIVLALKLSTS